ncbi:MAG: hypothetical protein JXP36_02115, partial [Bacteroidales bacterium]|nr:hypothetical protein [Bacteroidales bacterium]
MRLNKVLFIVFILCSNPTFSQINWIADTSYTVNSAFNKSIKKFPFIEIVKPQKYENVIEEKSIVYKEIG